MTSQAKGLVYFSRREVAQAFSTAPVQLAVLFVREVLYRPGMMEKYSMNFFF